MAIGKRLPIQVITRKALQSALIAKRVVDAAVSSLNKDSLVIERDMKKRAPVAFGEIHSHIGTVGPKRSGNAVAFEVGVRGLNYAQFVEFGTGPAGGESGDKVTALARDAMQELGYTHGAGNFSPPVDEIRRWLKRKGLPLEFAWAVARKIGRRGLPAKPFVFPAYEERRDKIVPNMRTAVEKALREGGA